MIFLSKIVHFYRAKFVGNTTFFLIPFFLLVIQLGFAQEDTLKWKYCVSFPLSSNGTWYVLASNKLITAEKEQMQQVDTNGVVLFKQSIKNSGTINQIDASNKLKTLIFSAEQQLINFVDNTLTPQQASIELASYDLSYVSLVSASVQNDRFWVYDQDNSTLMLISSRTEQNQRIENVAGLLGISKPISLQEDDNKLYLLDENRGLFVFDNFGTFVQFWEVKQARSVDIQGNMAYFIAENQLVLLDMRTDKETRIPLPEKEILEVQKTNDAFYFRTKNAILKYKIEILQK